MCVKCLTIRHTRDVFSPDDEFGEEPSDVENCIRTKWPEAAMINLLLTGGAAANVFNGDIEYSKNGRKLVGSMLKTPRFPVWVVKCGERFGVMFSLNKDLVNDWRLERRFELYYCTGSAKRNSSTDECVYIVDTRDVFSPDDEFGEEPSDVENCIRTKWPEAVIELKEGKS